MSVAAPLVLVVDDDPDILELIGLKLTGLGYDVHTRTDGNAALTAARSLHPALMVLDWMMPGRTGIEVLETLRSDPDAEFARIPVLLATARSQPDDIARAEAAGTNGYLTKPFSLRDLGTRVAEVIGPA